MNDSFYASKQVNTSSEQNHTSSFLDTPLTLRRFLWAVGISVAVIIVCVVAFSVFGKARMTSTDSAVAVDPQFQQSQVAAGADDRAFRYQGQAYLDGKQYNVTLVVQGLTATDAIAIARQYVGG